MKSRRILSLLLLVSALIFFVACNSEVEPEKGAFRVGSVYYETLQKAVDAISASKGKSIDDTNTIYLTRDVSDAGATIGIEVGLNFGNHVYTLVNSSDGIVVESGSKIRISGGTIKAGSGNEAEQIIKSAGEVTIEDTSLDVSDADININAVVATAGSFTVSGNSAIKANKNNKALDLTGATVEVKGTATVTGEVKASGESVVTVSENSKVEGKVEVVESQLTLNSSVKSSVDLTVKDATLEFNQGIEITNFERGKGDGETTIVIAQDAEVSSSSPSTTTLINSIVAESNSNVEKPNGSVLFDWDKYIIGHWEPAEILQVPNGDVFYSYIIDVYDDGTASVAAIIFSDKDGNDIVGYGTEYKKASYALKAATTIPEEIQNLIDSSASETVAYVKTFEFTEASNSRATFIWTVDGEFNVIMPDPFTGDLNPVPVVLNETSGASSKYSALKLAKDSFLEFFGFELPELEGNIEFDGFEPATATIGTTYSIHGSLTNEEEFISALEEKLGDCTIVKGQGDYGKIRHYSFSSSESELHVEYYEKSWVNGNPVYQIIWGNVQNTPEESAE